MDNEREPEQEIEMLDSLEDDSIESDELDISISDQRFIQENFQNMSPEQIAVATRLPLEAITQYMEIYEEEARKRGIDPHQHFSLSITLDKDNIFGFGIQFPREDELQSSIEPIARLLYAMNEGDLKPSLVAFLYKFAEQRKADELISKILEQWGGLVANKYGKERPLVRADEVLK